MEFEVEQISSIRKKLNFSVPEPIVRSALDKAYRDLQRRARLPGFRPGKTPRAVLRRRFSGQIRDQVANDLVQKAFKESVLEQEYFGQPQVDTRGVVEGQSFEFSFILEVEPELKLDVYIGVDVVYPRSEMSDAVVDSQIGSQLRSQASLANVEEDRPVESGDDVLTRIVVREGEETLHEALGAAIRIGRETHYAGLDSHLIGRTKGETFNVEVTFAAEVGVPELAEKTAEVELEILEIREMRTPELDDTVAIDLGHESAQAMRDATRDRLQSALDNQNRNQARANLLRVLVDANPFDVPAALTDQYLEALKQELQIQHLQRGRDVRNLQFSDTELADLRTRALFAARSSLILKHVSELEGLDVVEAELEAKIQEIADARGQRVEAIKGYLAAEGATDELRDRILEEKTLDWLLARANHIDPPVPPEADDAADTADESAEEE